MNRENIKRVRDHIAGLPPERFDMEAWPLPEATSCGTPACIGGWAAALLFPERNGWVFSAEVYEALGLDEETATALCFPAEAEAGAFAPYEATPTQAVAVLDHLLETGEVDWSVAERVPA